VISITSRDTAYKLKPKIVSTYLSHSENILTNIFGLLRYFIRSQIMRCKPHLTYNKEVEMANHINSSIRMSKKYKKKIYIYLPSVTIFIFIFYYKRMYRAWLLESIINKGQIYLSTYKEAI